MCLGDDRCHHLVGDGDFTTRRLLEAHLVENGLEADARRYLDLKDAQQGDRVEAPNNKAYDVASVKDDDSARIVLVLVKA